MKLAQVDHERCGEIRATTYVWVSDHMDREVFAAYVKTATNLYLTYEGAFKIAPRPVPPGYEPNYKQYPNMTVAEVQALHQVEVIAYKEWAAKQEDTRKTFAELLVEVGEGHIRHFTDIPTDSLSTTVNWGHRHGTTVRYGEVDICSCDFNAAAAGIEDGL
jgi:hypothetical protein